jgi:hypothetical protein
MKRSSLVLGLLLTMVIAAFCQPRQAVLRMSPLTASGIGESEASMLERLIVSYIAELRQFRIIDAKGQDLALSETESALSLGVTSLAALPLAADYIVTGALGKIGEVFIITLENTKVASGEKISVSDTALTISDIVLRSKDLTLSLFGRTPAAKPVQGSVTVQSPASISEPVREKPLMSELVGTWRGDKGLETVRIFQNGTGLAVLSGGGTLKLRISIDTDTIIVMQDQANSPSMFRTGTVTLEMARKLTEEARPMRWVFKLSENGQHLWGSKETVSISGSGAAMQIDNTYVRDASWAKLAR